MLFDESEDYSFYYEDMNKQCPDYNGQPRSDDGRFGKGSQNNKTSKPTSNAYAPMNTPNETGRKPPHA